MKEFNNNIVFKSEIYFNKIYVIESLKSNDKKTGKSLHDDLIRWKVYNQKILNSEFKIVRSKPEFFGYLGNIYGKSKKNNEFPIIHIEIHGSKTGLTLNNGDKIEWEELYSIFQEINIQIKNNLFLTLACCYGTYIFNTINPLNPSPFYGFIAPLNEKKSYEIENDFLEFYKEILTNFNLVDAVKSLNLSDSKNQYMHFNSELLFDKLYDKFEREDEYGNSMYKTNIRRGLEELVQIKSEIDERVNIIASDKFTRKKLRKACRKRFLILDLK